MAPSDRPILWPVPGPVDGRSPPGDSRGLLENRGAESSPDPDAPHCGGIEVREQCSCCHREVRETLAGVCFDCLIPL